MAGTFEISEEQRRTVRAMAGFGMPLRDIAAYLETDEAALQRHMGTELSRAALEANAKVAQALFTMATQDKNVIAAIFWMKARALWRDRPDAAAAQAAEPRQVKIVRYTWGDGSGGDYEPEQDQRTLAINTGVRRDGPNGPHGS